MHLCYIDESGVPEIPGNTTHYVLAGLSIPIARWRECEDRIQTIKQKYGLAENEIHVAWILRPYVEQNNITDFDLLNWADRRNQVRQLRTAEYFRLQKGKDTKRLQQFKKNTGKTEAYTHLTFAERTQFIHEVAQTIGSWDFARLFAECIDKVHFDPVRSNKSTDEQAFEQVVSRYERYLQLIDNGYGLLIHDNNQTVAKKHTDLMRRFYQNGTLWTSLRHIVETPLFVDSQLTSMIQLADLCSYALRRYLENNETTLFDSIFQRADRVGRTVVGVRHFTVSSCQCRICASHRRYA